MSAWTWLDKHRWVAVLTGMIWPLAIRAFWLEYTRKEAS
jgi:hypothetical protein